MCAAGETEKQAVIVHGGYGYVVGAYRDSGRGRPANVSEHRRGGGLSLRRMAGGVEVLVVVVGGGGRCAGRAGRVGRAGHVRSVSWLAAGGWR